MFHTMIVGNLRMKNVLDVATVSLTSRCQSKRGKPSGHTGETLELGDPRDRVLACSRVLVCASGNYASPTSPSTKRSRRVPTCPVHVFKDRFREREVARLACCVFVTPHKVGGQAKKSGPCAQLASPRGGVGLHGRSRREHTSLNATARGWRWHKVQRLVNGVVVWRAWLAWTGADGWLGTVLGVHVLPGMRDLPTDVRSALFCCVVTPRGGDEPESRRDVAHEVGARHSPPLVARERVRLDPVRLHPRTGQGESRTGPVVQKSARVVPVCSQSVSRAVAPRSQVTRGGRRVCGG